MALNGKYSEMVLKGEPSRMTLLSPRTGEAIVRQDTGEECWIEFHSPQSDIARSLDRRLLDKALRRRNPRASVRDVEGNVLEKLAGLTKDWLLAFPDGRPIDEPCNHDNALAFYTDVLWMRDQASNFVNDLGNFLTTPSENSSTSLSTSSDSAA